MRNPFKSQGDLVKISRTITMVFAGIAVPFLPIILAFFIPNITMMLVDGPLILCCEHDASDVAIANANRQVAEVIIDVCLWVFSLIYVLWIFAVIKSPLYKGKTEAKVLCIGLTAVNVVLFCAAASKSFPADDSGWWDFVWRGWWF